MKRIIYFKHGAKKSNEKYVALDDDSAQDSMKSSSVYTASIQTMSSVKPVIKEDDSDTDSKASSIESRSRGHLELDEDMNYYLKKCNGNAGNDNVKGSRLDREAEVVEEIEDVEMPSSKFGRPARKVSVTPKGSATCKGEEHTERETETQGVFSWHRNSSRRFKVAFYTTCALFVVFLVMLVALFVTQGGGGTDSNGNPTTDQLKSPGSEPREEPVSSPATPLAPQASPVSNATGGPVLQQQQTAPTAYPAAVSPPSQAPTTTPRKPLTAAPIAAAASISPTAGPVVAGPVCVDSDVTFVLDEQEVNCTWLSEHIASQIVYCDPFYPEPYSLCAMTCKNCSP